MDPSLEPLEELVTVLLAMGALLLALSTLTVWLAVRSVRRRNRVSPRVPTSAPAGWLWSPGTGAQLHRRLRRCVVSARAAVGALPRRAAGSPVLGGLVEQLESEACAVDRHLVAAGRCPPAPRRRLLHEAHAEVVRIEGLTERILRMARTWPLAGAPAPVPLRERLDALEGAVGEVVTLR
jgi:hypothetical protein